MKKQLFILLISCIAISCSSGADTEKHQKSRNNVINIQDKIKGIEIDDVIMGSTTRLFQIKNKLIIADYNAYDFLTHILDKNNFTYITSTALKGQGPDEITNMGHIGIDEAKGKFYISDHGKNKIFSYDIDSVVSNNNYSHSVKTTIKETAFPSDYEYINDTLSIAIIIKPTGDYGFTQQLGKWNINTGEIEPLKYENPNITKKRVKFALSQEDNIYVECYSNYDLMTICDLEGNLKFNVYGPNWSDKETNKIHHFGKVSFYKDKIVASYSGGDNFTDEYYPTKFIIFDVEGNYLKTLETECMISDFCIDKDNNRVILNLNHVDENMQFAYFDIEGIL